MFKRELYLVFGLVFVCVVAQQRPIRPPKPPRVSGSYSDYPGLLVNKNPIQTKRQENVQNNILPVLPQNVPKEPSTSSISRINSGPIVIPAASSSYGSFPSQGSPQAAPPQASSFSGLPKSAQGIPVSVVAAAELTQQYEKPTAPLKTGTDTWTPMGFTGDGKTFDMTSTARPSPGMPGKSSPVVTPQPVPYDPTKSKQTIGQQIIERQKQQQQQQQYDIFGFPIDNSPGTSQSEIKQSHDPLEVIVNTIEMQIDQSRHRRHAVRGDLNGIAEPIKKFYPPKPPKDLPMPAPRRRPPPPPPLQEEMFKNQQETVQPKTKSQPRYSGVSKAPSKKVDTKPAKPSPVTTTTTTTTAKPPPSTPVTKTKSKPVPKAKKVITSKTKGTPKLPLKPNKTEKSKAKPYMKSEAVNHEQNAVNALEAGESPKEALNAEANLELQALIGSSNAADYHGHAHEHAPHDHSHGHTHTHAHPESQTQKPANRNNGPPAEMQAKFSSMFNAWYNAKFGDVQSPPTEATTAQPKYVTAKSKQTKQPSTVYTPKKRAGPVTKSVDKNALFKEFMTMFQSQLKIGEKAKSATNYQAKVTTKPVKTKAATMSPITTTKAATTTPTTKAPQTKAYVSNSKAKETNSKTKASSSKAKATYEKSPTAKFGPRKKNDYMKPTTKPTPVYPNLQTTAAVANDPTQVKLVTLSHPESLAYPSNETSQTATGSNTSMTSPNGVSTPPIQNTGATGMNIEVLTRQEFTGRQKYPTTTIRPTPDPDFLADINEARVNLGLPEVQAHQVDVHGNLLPFYKRQMRIGRLPARPHPIHNPGRLHHQLQHQHDLPHYHPEQGIGAGYNHFPNLFYPQPTNNGAVMAYEPFPRPNSQGPTTAAPITRAAKHLPNTMNVAPIPMVDAGPLNPLAYLYFFNALSNLLQPQNNRGYMAQLYGNGNGQGYNNLFNQNRQNNGMPGSYAFSQLAHRHASGQNQASEHTQASAGAPSSNTNGLVHGDLGGGSHAHSNIDMHHQAIHREAGNALTPDLHRQVHRLLRNRELSRQRGNMFGMGMQNFPAATQTPFIDPDLYADMMEARAAALAG